ncbi:MAG TPA: ThuA domain-containing protein [Acidisarcina sp.]
MKKVPILTIAALAVLCGPAVLAKRAPSPVLIVDGQSGGPYHAWQLTTPVLKRELDDTGLFAVTVATTGADLAAFQPNFGSYKAVVMNYDAPDWPANLRTELESYVKNGGGLVIVHAADNAFPDWPAYNEMTGIGGWRNRDEKSGPYWFFKDGKLISDPAPGPAGSHGARVPFQVTTRDPGHPIMRGLPPMWMHAGDELYATLRGPGKNMTVLATAHSDPENKGTGRDEPILMTIAYGKGRVFHTMLGHDVAALSCVGFITTLQRGTEWAATGKVTQKVPVTFPTADTTSVRTDIARMDPQFVASAPTAAAPGAIAVTAATKAFGDLADTALATMAKKAQDLKINGVAVVAYFDGESVQSWASKMVVVGHVKVEPSATDKGSNLLAIAYAKAAEMADTLKNSGSKVRPPLTGEFGWEGGVIARGRSGYIIAAFSGGQSSDDVQVSRAGLEVLKTGL